MTGGKPIARLGCCCTNLVLGPDGFLVIFSFTIKLEINMYSEEYGYYYGVIVFVDFLTIIVVYATVM